MAKFALKEEYKGMNTARTSIMIMSPTHGPSSMTSAFLSSKTSSKAWTGTTEQKGTTE
jgi:hypothetical protein